MEWLNYHHLRYFWAAAREGSVTRASAKLHISQPAVSTQIRGLEQALGEKLFTRSGRILALVFSCSMRTGRPKSALVLTLEERNELVNYRRRWKTSDGLATRAAIVLTCAEGLDNKSVAKRLRLSNATVGKWRSRFVESRLDGLLDKPRPGAPRKISDAQVERVG